MYREGLLPRAAPNLRVVALRAIAKVVGPEIMKRFSVFMRILIHYVSSECQ
jgi:hypothetical protein